MGCCQLKEEEIPQIGYPLGSIIDDPENSWDEISLRSKDVSIESTFRGGSITETSSNKHIEAAFLGTSPILRQFSVNPSRRDLKFKE